MKNLKLSDFEIAKNDVEKLGFALSIVKDGRRMYQSRSSGIVSLVEAIERHRNHLKGAYAADRILGRAAALLLIYSGVKCVYASIASNTALASLKEYKIPFYCKRNVPEILNNEMSSACPFEQLVKNIKVPEKAFHRLKAFLASAMKY